MKKGCLFDLDGTLVNSIEDLAFSTNEVLKKHHCPTYEVSDYNFMVGNGIRKLIERALPSDQQDLLDECLKEFYTIYSQHCLDHTVPYPGIVQLIDDLRQEGVQLAVVTNKPHHLAIKIVEHLFPSQFVAIYGQQDLYPVKPAPDSSLLALMTMRLRKEECFFIGDSNVDIETGYQLEMDTIGVSWGFRGRKELEDEGATYVVDHPSMIMSIINENRDE